MKDFGPDLANGVVVGRVRKLFGVAFENEKASGSGLITKEFVIVGGGGENALTREFVGASAVLKTSAVNLTRNKGFDLLVLGFFCGLHFGQFDDPQTLKSFNDVFVGNGIELAEPVAAELSKDGRLADALFALQNETIIEFASRMKNASDGSKQPSLGDSAGIRRIFDAEPLDENRFRAGSLIPCRKVVEEVVNGMKPELVRVFDEAIVAGLRAAKFVVAIDEIANVRIVGVGDGLIVVKLIAPWESASRFDALRKAVESKGVFDDGIEKKNEIEVFRAIDGNTGVASLFAHLVSNLIEDGLVVIKMLPDDVVDDGNDLGIADLKIPVESGFTKERKNLLWIVVGESGQDVNESANGAKSVFEEVILTVDKKEFKVVGTESGEVKRRRRIGIVGIKLLIGFLFLLGKSAFD